MNAQEIVTGTQKKKANLTTYIVVGLILGVIFGYFMPEQAMAIKPVGDVFLRMIKMIVVPLVFSSLIVGIAGTESAIKLGKVGVKSIVWFEIATTMALLVAMIMGNWIRPGAGIDMALIDPGSFSMAGRQAPDLLEFIINVVPTNIIDGMARQSMLQIVFFATFFGIAASAAGSHGKPVVDLAKSVSEIMFKLTWYIMQCAPIGVFAFMSFTVGKFGLGMLLPLGKLVLSIYAALFVFIVITLVPACTYFGINFLHLLRAVKEPILIGFGTTSSEAALPILMKKLEEFGCPRAIVNFVLPTGYSFNLDGATLNAAFSILFLAQLYNVDIGWGQQLAVILALMLSTKGIAAVSGGAIAIIAGTAASLGIPVEGIALLLAIDRFTDMARTVTNIIGNSVATVLVSRWEGELSDDTLQAAYEKNYDD